VFKLFKFLKKKIILKFKISYFEYCQIWLNTLMDDHHLSNITKLKKKKPWVATDGTLTRGHFNFFKFCDMEFKIYFLKSIL
jgi:hypothetical protein